MVAQPHATPGVAWILGPLPSSTLKAEDMRNIYKVIGIPPWVAMLVIPLLVAGGLVAWMLAVGQLGAFLIALALGCGAGVYAGVRYRYQRNRRHGP